MSKITHVYGCSDDLVELDGAIYDEIGLSYRNPAALVTFDNGARLIVRYDDEGVWRIEDQSLRPGLVEITECENRPGYDGPDGAVYSDEAAVTGAAKFRWENHYEH